MPCPVCYVFSRYVNNGDLATIAINGQRKYGDKLVDPSTLSEEEKKERIQYWVDELEKQDELNEKYKKTINKAKADIKTLLGEIDSKTGELVEEGE